MFNSTTTSKVKQRVSVTDTLRNLKAGEFVVFRARDFAPYGSVRSAVSRLNAGRVDPQFTVCSYDNGERYSIKRHY